MKLNLGCGSEKLSGYINIDVEENCKPNIIANFSKGFLPFKSNSMERVVMFHTIEHIEKRNHKFILAEVNRVLCDNGIFVLSYPEFEKCVNNYITNKQGKRSFWEATIFGRQLYKSDYHVCAMNTSLFTITVRLYGFDVLKIASEQQEDYNTVLVLKKLYSPLKYEDILRETVYANKE